MKEKIRAFVEGNFFTTLIFALIALNTISLGVETFKLSPSATEILSIFNTVCLVMFVLEILLKLYVYGLDFFKDGWNIFDTLIVLISIMPMITFLSSMRAFRIFRMFRALRALRMMKRLEKLRIIVQALLGALPSVGWVVLLLLIIYYVFAVIGTNLFSGISPEYFGSLWKTLYSLFQITMADDLGNISRPLLESGIGAVIYFVSFVVLSTILVLNVIVGVIVDSMEEVRNSVAKKDGASAKKPVNTDETSPEQTTKTVENPSSSSEILQEIHLLEQQLEHLKCLITDRKQ